MRRLRRFLAVALVLAVPAVVTPVVSSGSTQGDESESVVREVVVSVLDTDGRQRSTRVAQLVRLSGGGDEAAVQVPEGEALDDYRSLSGFSGPASSDGNLEWRTAGRKDTLSLADVERDLPLEVSVSYTLEGEPVSPDDIRGSSGAVEIEVSIENVSDETKQLTYSPVTGRSSVTSSSVFVPFEYSVTAEFPIDTWQRVEAENAYVQTNAEGDEVVVVPGVLTPPIGPERDRVVLEATGEDILLPRIRVMAFPRTSPLAKEQIDEQLSGLRGLHGGLSTINSTLGTIHEGTLQLVEGLEKMLEGVGERDEDTGEPVVEFDDIGTPTTAIGALGFIEDAIRERMLPGIGARDPETGEPIVKLDDTGTPTTAIGALGFIEDAIRERMLPGIGARDPETGEPIVKLDDEGKPTTAIGALGFIRKSALTNPEFTRPQPGLGGRVPKDYFQDCPACWDPDHPLFDPRTTEPKFQPAFREAFVMVSEGVGDALKQLHTFDPENPGLVDGLQQIRDGLGDLNSNLDKVSGESGSGFRDTLETLRATAVAARSATNDPVAVAGLDTVIFLADALLNGLGQRGPDGSPVITLGPDGKPTTVIGAIGFIQQAVGDQILPRIGARDPNSGKAVKAVDARGRALTLLWGLQSTKNSFDDRLIPGMDELIAGIDTLIGKLHTLDAENPGLVDGLEQTVEGLDKLIGKLHTLDPDDPGLVDGLEQTVEGLDKLIGKLHTFSEENPGLVDGLKLARSGAQQISQGIFAINELGLRTARNSVGESGDEVALDAAKLDEQSEMLEGYTFLAAGADRAFTTYVFEIEGQDSTSRDNAVRGGLIAFAGLALVVLGRRPGVLGV